MGIKRGLGMIALCALGALLGACSDDDAGTPPADASPDAEPRGDGGDIPADGAVPDGGEPGGDSGTLDSSTGDPDAAPAEFEISGVTGPDDDDADAWLEGAAMPTVSWSESTGASNYEATLYEADGTTVACETQQLVGTATSAEFADCTLTAGRSYRASVVAISVGARTPASNDPFLFGVNAIVIGQPDATTHEHTRVGLALPNDVLVVGTHLIVADQNNSRVLIWNTIPTQGQQQADLVLGQPDFSTLQSNYGGIGPAGFAGSNGVASDGTRLIVADRFNYRVLIWNTFPTRNNQPADVVLGQPDFVSNTSNNGGITAASMTEPWVWLGGGKLFVADRYNARVMIWNTIPTQNHAPADVVLGQPDLVSGVINNGGVTASSLADPGRGWVDGTRLFVPDLGNHRVLIWNTVPTVTNAAADLVLGQSTLLTNAPNTGGAASAGGLNSPIAVWALGTRVAVADYLNNRVLVWTTAIAANGQPADIVLGQPDASSTMVNGGAATPGTTSMSSPNAVGGDDTQLLVSDRFNNRVLFFPTSALATGAAASIALGQSDLSSGWANSAGPITATSFSNPAGVAQVGDGLAVADGSRGRVLIWDALPVDGDAPQRVLGRPDFVSAAPLNLVTTAATLCAPRDLHSDGMRLAIGEQCARRVTIWNALPTENEQAADLAVGQPDLMSSVNNNGGVLATSLSGRPAPHLAGDRLLVADPNNHRVLIWNTLPSANGAAADVVLGQPDMTSAAVNNGGVGAQSLAGPQGAFVHGERLIVVDSGNHRVLIWNAVPGANQAAAEIVVGQPNMSSASEAAPSASRLRSPRNAYVDAEGRLYVVDQGNHRILYWNEVPTENGVAADGVIGQPNLDTGLANNGGIGPDTLQGPTALVAIDDALYITDSGNDRVIVLPRP